LRAAGGSVAVSRAAFSDGPPTLRRIFPRNAPPKVKIQAFTPELMLISYYSDFFIFI